MQEIQQTEGLAVLRAVLRNSCQDALRVAAQDGELDQIGRIEQHIGIFLERIYPFHFGTTHVRPVGNCFPCGERPLVEIPHNASEQAVVTGRNAVVVIQGYAHYGVDEYSELSCIRDFVKHQLENEIWEEELRFENPHEHYVDMTPELYEMKMNLLYQSRDFGEKQ